MIRWYVSPSRHYGHFPPVRGDHLVPHASSVPAGEREYGALIDDCIGRLKAMGYPCCPVSSK